MKEKLCYQTHVTEAVNCCLLFYESQFSRCTVRNKRCEKMASFAYLCYKKIVSVVHTLVELSLNVVNRNAQITRSSEICPTHPLMNLYLPFFTKSFVYLFPFSHGVGASPHSAMGRQCNLLPLGDNDELGCVLLQWRL